jgi:hypothetical protein
MIIERSFLPLNTYEKWLLSEDDKEGYVVFLNGTRTVSRVGVLPIPLQKRWCGERGPSPILMTKNKIVFGKSTGGPLFVVIF